MANGLFVTKIRGDVNNPKSVQNLRRIIRFLQGKLGKDLALQDFLSVLSVRGFTF